MSENVIIRQLAQLQSMGLFELQDKFHELYGFKTTQINIRNLRARLAYRIQEVYYGGLSDKSKEQLVRIAQNDPLANLANNVPKQPIKGTRLTREWQGQKHEVIIHENNRFEYEGRFFKSLSAIAREITGTQWNGKVFFGLKKG